MIGLGVRLSSKRWSLGLEVWYMFLRSLAIRALKLDLDILMPVMKQRDRVGLLELFDGLL